MVDTNQTTLYDEYENVPLSEIPKSLVDAAQKEAKQKKLDKILVIEDDAKFTENSYQIYLDCLNQLPNDWDILSGGLSWVGYNPIKVSKNLVKIGDFSAAHFTFLSIIDFLSLRIFNPKDIFSCTFICG